MVETTNLTDKFAFQGASENMRARLGSAKNRSAGTSHVQVPIATAAEAADTLAGLVRPRDVVLIKGSRSVGLEAVATKLRS